MSQIIMVKSDLKMMDLSKVTPQAQKPSVYLNGHDGYFYNQRGIIQQIRTLGEIKEFGYTQNCMSLASLEKLFNDKKITMSKYYLEANDGAGNTFKATAKPVLIGTAVVGATTMIFALILVIEHTLGWFPPLLSIIKKWESKIQKKIYTSVKHHPKTILKIEKIHIK